MEAGEEEEEVEEEEEEGCTRPFCMMENERALPVCCCEEEEGLRDPLDREGMCEVGSEPERAGNMEGLVREGEEELAWLVVAGSGAHWEPLVELG